jgi:hypothetical protein
MDRAAGVVQNVAELAVGACARADSPVEVGAKLLARMATLANRLEDSRRETELLPDQGKRLG